MPVKKIIGMALGLLVVAGVVAAVVMSIVSPQTSRKPYWLVSTPSVTYVAQVVQMPFSGFVLLKNTQVYTEQLDADKKLVRTMNPISVNNPIFSSNSIYLNKDQIILKNRVEKCSGLDASIRKTDPNLLKDLLKDCPQLSVQAPAPAPAAPAPVPAPVPAK